MTSNSSNNTGDSPGENQGKNADVSSKPVTQSEHRKRRLAEQLRQNLRNRKTQARERRNFDKQTDD